GIRDPTTSRGLGDVYKRQDKDLILGMVEKGHNFINHLHELLRSRLSTALPLIFAVTEKIAESSVPQVVTSFFSVDHQINAQIVV
ncbi:hypothetical protein DNP31_23890, partial [Salmonella enterica subsp. enterica serovar Panama]